MLIAALLLFAAGFLLKYVVEGGSHKTKTTLSVVRSTVDGMPMLIRTSAGNDFTLGGRERRHVQEPLLSAEVKEFIARYAKIAGIGVIALMLFWYLVYWVQTTRALWYVLKHRASVAKEIGSVKKRAQHPDVTEKTREGAKELEYAFAQVAELTVDSGGVDWIKMRHALDTAVGECREYRAVIWDEVRSARRARKEGPELMKKMPDLIAAAERKLATGTLSVEASWCLARAQVLFADARERESKTGKSDWLAIYRLLVDVQVNLDSTVATHAAAQPFAKCQMGHFPGATIEN